jgi:hypothetical protein
MRDDVHVLRLREPIPGSYRSAVDHGSDDVVDFASVTALVGRMQDAFFSGDGEPSPVVAEVQLSVRQALVGGRVPVEVPLKRPCPMCEGRGEVGDDSCHACGGTGDRVTVEPVNVFVPSGVSDGARFRLRLRVPAASQTAVELRVRVR